jgi:hypothetical protein
MRTLTSSIVPLITCLILACGPSDHSDSSTHGHDSTGHTTTAATTTGTTTADATEGAETHASHASHGEHGESTDATGEPTTSTGGESTTHASTGTTHATHHTDSGDTDGVASPEAYCACMLVNCHDQYHGTWGEEHPASEEMCAAAAAALPSVGMPATRGNSLECRMHHCELGHDDPAACESAIGGGACA